MTSNLSYQLYSSRNFPPLDQTLRRIAQAGYTQVEGYGAVFQTNATVLALKRSLSETGLDMPTAHFSLDMLHDAPEQIIATARLLDMQAVIIPFTAEQDRTASEWTAFGRGLAEAGKPIIDAGLELGWHNHAFEFADLGGDQIPLDLILGASDTLKLELDIAWAQVAGHDPLKLIKRYSDRLIAVHLKDIAHPGTNLAEDGWADVGHGILNWPAIMAELGKTNTRFHVIEHDNPSDDQRFAERSIAAARRFLAEIQ